METKIEAGRGKDIRSDINEDASERLANKDDHYNSVTSLASIGSVVINYSTYHPQSKPKTRFLPNGGRLVATLYAIIIVLLSAAFTVKEALQKTWLTDYVIAVFLAYLYGISTIFIIFLEVYLVREARRHALIPKEKKPKTSIFVKNATVEADNQVSNGIVNRGFAESTDDGDSHPSIDDVTSRSRADSQHMTDNIELYIIGDIRTDAQLPHHTSFYLRIGAVIFGLGSMVYDGLLLKQLQENHSPSSCGEHHHVWPHYIHLIFLLVQTYFIFKHPQVRLIKLKPLARLGFMHLLSANWSVWIRTLVRETLDSYLRHENPVHQNYTQTIYNTEKTMTDMGCNTDSDILQQAAPYLFPCVLEYSLLAMATMYSMYADVGFLYKKDKDDSPEQPCQSSNGHPDHVHLTEVNFHKTHRGLFIGIIVLAATCVSIILFFSYMNNDASSDVPVLIYYVSSLALSFMCISINAIAWFQIRKLPSMRIGRTTVDDVMLMVAMSGLLLFNMFKIMPVIQSLWTGYGSVLLYLQLCDCLLIMVMGVFQTCFLLDGLCRFTTSKDILKDKPGRGSVTFLLLANIALWLLKTFQIKEVELDDELQDNAYSYLAWQIIIHSCIPLLIFYHYHSSACLAQIWSSSYKAVGEEESPKSNQVRHTNNATTISTIQTSDETPRSIVLKRRIPNNNLVDSGMVVSPISNV